MKQPGLRERLLARRKSFDQEQALLKSIQGKPAQVDEPPEIVRLALLNFLPDLSEKVTTNYVLSMAAAQHSKEAAWAASKSSQDFKALVAWLRSIGADANYLGLMEDTLCKRLNQLAEDASPIEH